MKRILLLACLFAVPGFAQDAASDVVRKVTSKLDAGGHFYMFWNPDELRNQITPLVKTLWDAAQKDPDFDEESRMAGQLAAKFYQQSGLEEIGGVGMSSLQKTGEMVQTKSYTLREGPSDGLLWKIWTPEEDKLTGLRQLPATTAYAVYGQYSIDAMWEWIQVVGAGTPIQDGIAQMKKGAKEDNVDIDRILRSLSGDWGYAITLDPANKVNLPGTPPNLKVPAPGAIAIANVSSPILFQTLIEKLRQAGGAQAKIESVDAGQLFIMPSPAPDLPFEFAPTLHYSQKQILFATNPALMKEMLENRASAKTSLLREPGFRSFADSRLVTANQIHYFSPLLSKTIGDIAATMGEDMPEVKTMADVLMGKGEPYGSLTTIKAEVDGISVQTTANKRGMRAWIMQYGVPQFGPQLLMFGTVRAAPVGPPGAFAPVPDEAPQLKEF